MISNLLLVFLYCEVAYNWPKRGRLVGLKVHKRVSAVKERLGSVTSNDSFKCRGLITNLSEQLTDIPMECFRFQWQDQVVSEQ